MNVNIKLVFVVIIFFSLVGCQSNGKQSTSSVLPNNSTCSIGSKQCCGKVRGSFLGGWFDYYERGLSYADCLMWPEAYADLSIAISKRGYDKRRVYTLGMHFVTNYFPHREIGVVLYNQGKYQEAHKHLKISLKQFPSTKAENYLNKTRIKLQQVIVNEKSSPNIALISKEKWSNQKGRTLELIITDDSFIDKIWIDGNLFIWQDVTIIDKSPVSIQRAKPSIKINKVISTHKAKIVVEAQDIFGNKTTKIIKNRIDVLQPEISISNVDENEFGEIIVEGIISDLHSGIEWINVGEGRIKLSGKNSFEFSFVAESDVFNISTQDIAGNTLSISRPVKLAQALSIDLQSTDSINTQENSWILSGWIESSDNITSYSINDQKFTTNGTRLHISYEQNLDEGINNVKLTVNDASGNSISQTTQITRTVPHHLNNNERLLMALFPFSCDQNTGVSCENSLDVYQRMDEEVRARKRFQLVERATLSDQLDSLKICELMVTDKCAWQAAQLIKTQSMFVGEMIIRKSPSGSSEEVYARIIDADNGSVLISFDAYRENLSKDTEHEETINKQLYVKLHERFPLLSTESLSVDGNEITADFDSEFKFWKNMPMKIFNDEKACAQGIVVKNNSVNNGKTKVELNNNCKAKGKKRLVTL
jgi:hypothetical protein